MALSYTQWSGGHAFGTGNAFTSGTLTVSTGDFITICYAVGNYAVETDWAVTLDASASAITWAQSAKTDAGVSCCKCVLFTGIAGATPPTTITVTPTAGSNYNQSKWMSIIAHTGAHATTPIPAGNIFKIGGSTGTDCSQAITPTSVGSALWMFVADWQATNSYQPIDASCTLGTVYHEGGQQTCCTIRPTTQPRTDTSAFTVGETDASGVISWIAFEIQAAAAAGTAVPVFAHHYKMMGC